MSRSKSQIVEVTVGSIGAKAGLLMLGQRQLEKSAPPAVRGGATHATYQVPVDVLRVIGDDLDKGIKSITFTYRVKGVS